MQTTSSANMLAVNFYTDITGNSQLTNVLSIQWNSVVG